MTKINYINIIHKHTIIGFLKRNIFCFNNQFISTIYYFYIFIPFFFLPSSSSQSSERRK